MEQGFVASEGKNANFSEAVIVHFDQGKIPLRDLMEFHLHTHKSTSNHTMRTKYRSSVYTFSEDQANEAKGILKELQREFENGLVTKVYPFQSFKPSEKKFKNYHFENLMKPFCESFINPKLKLLLPKFLDKVNRRKIEDFQVETGTSNQ